MEFIREINQSVQQTGQADTNEELEIKKELEIKDELEIKEEPISDGENEMIIPDIADVADVDPLQIDEISQVPQKVLLNCKNTPYELWYQNRKVELRSQFPDLSEKKILSLLNKEWKALPDMVKEIWNNRVKPTRQSTRPRKPKEIKDIPDIKRVTKKSAVSRPFKRQYIAITLYPDNYGHKKQLEFNKIQEAVIESNKEKEKKKQKTNLRYTAYTLWAKEVGEVLRKQCPNISFIETSKRRSEMWKELSALEKYNYRRRAKRLNQKIVKKQPEIQEEENKVTKISSKGRVIAKSIKLSNFRAFETKYKRQTNDKFKAEPLPLSSKRETELGMQMKKQDSISNSQIEKRVKGKRRSKSP